MTKKSFTYIASGYIALSVAAMVLGVFHVFPYFTQTVFYLFTGIGVIGNSVDLYNVYKSGK